MPIARSVLVLLAALLFVSPAASQVRWLAGHGTLTGVVRDSATGAPVPGVRLVARGGITWTDSAGGYLLNPEPGAQRIRVFCPSATLFHPLRLPEARVQIHADSATTLDLRIDRGACTEPKPDSVYAEFTGHFVAEFENANFVPCPGTVERIWRPLYGNRRIWVHFTDAAFKRGPRPWPAAETGKKGGRRFARWKGRLTGPGDHGHMGMSPYLLTVTEILEIRTPAPGDCR